MRSNPLCLRRGWGVYLQCKHFKENISLLAAFLISWWTKQSRLLWSLRENTSVPFAQGLVVTGVFITGPVCNKQRRLHGVSRWFQAGFRSLNKHKSCHGYYHVVSSYLLEEMISKRTWGVFKERNESKGSLQKFLYDVCFFCVFVEISNKMKTCLILSRSVDWIVSPQAKNIQCWWDDQ